MLIPHIYSLHPTQQDCYESMASYKQASYKYKTDGRSVSRREWTEREGIECAVEASTEVDG